MGKFSTEPFLDFFGKLLVLSVLWLVMVVGLSAQSLEIVFPLTYHNLSGNSVNEGFYQIGKTGIENRFIMAGDGGFSAAQRCHLYIASQMATGFLNIGFGVERLTSEDISSNTNHLNNHYLINNYCQKINVTSDIFNNIVPDLILPEQLFFYMKTPFFLLGFVQPGNWWKLLGVAVYRRFIQWGCQ